MSYTRLAALVATFSCALLLGGAGTAAAQTGTATAEPFAKVVPVKGTAANGKRLRGGTFTIQRFARRSGELVAVGTLKGRFRGRQITRRNVRMPATFTNTAGASASQIPPIPGACTILNLSIEPINLNLLGLSVRTSRIDLRIDAVPGPGNLLGNLLCAITGLLDPDALANTTLGQLTRILNALLALAPRTA